VEEIDAKSEFLFEELGAHRHITHKEDRDDGLQGNFAHASLRYVDTH
jgi:hypothetical protein